MRWEHDDQFMRYRITGQQKRVGNNHSSVYTMHMQNQGSCLSKENYLCHYGIPGQKWGVITKEYEKKGYNTGPRASIARKRRYRQQQYEFYKKEGRERGNQVGEKWFSSTYDKIRKQEAAKQSQAEQERKPDVIDKTMEKVTDHLGLRAYSDMASSFIKQQAQNAATNWIKDVKNRRKLASILQKPLGVAGKGIASVMGNTGKYAKAALKGTAKYTFKGAKFIGKQTGKAVVSTAKWLHNGGSKKIVNAISQGSKFIINNAKFLSKNASAIHAVGTRYATAVARQSMQVAMRGAVALKRMLKARRR